LFRGRFSFVTARQLLLWFNLASPVPPVRPEGHVRIVPDIAVEVVSPTGNVYEPDENEPTANPLEFHWSG
jgi:hypothetical protein